MDNAANALPYREDGEEVSWNKKYFDFITRSCGAMDNMLPTEQKIPGSSPGKIDDPFIIILFPIIIFLP